MQDAKEVDHTVSQDPLQGYLPYRNDEHNIKMLYPKGWKKAEGNVGTGLLFCFQSNQLFAHCWLYSRFLCLAKGRKWVDFGKFTGTGVTGGSDLKDVFATIP